MMFTGMANTGGIPVDLHTLAVSIVSKEREKKKFAMSRGQYREICRIFPWERW